MVKLDSHDRDAVERIQTLTQGRKEGNERRTRQMVWNRTMLTDCVPWNPDPSVCPQV